MASFVVHYQDLTSEGMGVFSVSLCWGEHWFKSMSQLRQDCVHEFGNDFDLIDMKSLSDTEYSELEALHVCR